jgi:3-oxocholest-4-en-26-oate---CoA ligase
VSLASPVDGTAPPDDAALIAHTKQHLSGYKCPKRVVVVDEVRRGPNGKADHRWAAALVAATPVV